MGIASFLMHVDCLNGSVDLDGSVATLTANNAPERVQLPARQLARLFAICAERSVDAYGWKRAQATIDSHEVAVTMSAAKADPRYGDWAEIQVTLPAGFCTLFLDEFAISQIAHPAA